ncbi:MAG TPA: GAF domain-containing protein [Candidatus Binatia bacterium]|jgi:signal transduction histidine kinase/FixJ family two-component response regulator
MPVPLNVLIVEDRPADAELMLYELERVGFEPLWKRVETESDYLAELERTPDVVLADHTLPGFGAPQALDLLKERGLDIPFIVVTGSISEDVAVARLKQGASDYILKDRMVRLGEAVTRALREKRLRDEKSKAEEALKKRYQELQVLQEISQIILTAPDSRATLDRILAKAISVGSFDLGIIRLFDPRTGRVTPVAFHGYRDPENIQRNDQRTLDDAAGTLTAQVLIFKEPRVEEDVPNSHGLRTWKKEGVQSAIIIPLRASEVMGVFQLGSRTRRKFSPDEVRLLASIADQTGIAIQKSRLHEETRQNLERIRALREIDLAITSTLELNTILNVLLEKIEVFLPIAAATTVRLLNRETRELESLACRGIDEQDWKSAEPRALAGRAKQIVETKAPLAVRVVEEDARTYNRGLYRKYALVSYLGVPLVAKDEVLGVLGLYTKEEHDFSAAEVEFFNTLAGHAAIAIHNAQLFDQSRKQATELERANKVKDEFLNVMSHELRTPLSVVMGYAGMVKEKMLGDVNPRQEEALQKVLNRAADQLHMINSIMQTTQLEARATLAERRLINLSQLLTYFKADYELTHDKTEVALIWNYPSEPVPIVTDSGKLLQVLQNLIDNAVKFTDRGAVTVSLRVVSRPASEAQAGDRAESPEGKWVELKIADTGVGMTPEQIPHIFEKFYQIDSSETRLYGGVGLGLYIVKKFTELLKGTIEVQSEPEKGSAFTVVLPWES